MTNPLKFLRIGTIGSKPVAIFAKDKLASREIIQYDKDTFKALPMTKDNLTIFKLLNEYGDNPRDILS